MSSRTEELTNALRLPDLMKAVDDICDRAKTHRRAPAHEVNYRIQWIDDATDDLYAVVIRRAFGMTDIERVIASHALDNDIERIQLATRRCEQYLSNMVDKRSIVQALGDAHRELIEVYETIDV